MLKLPNTGEGGPQTKDQEVHAWNGHTTEPVQSSETWCRLMLESVTDYAILVLDPGGHIVDWSMGAQWLKGYSRDEIIGRHFSLFYPDEDLKSGKPAYELQVAKAEGRFEDEGCRLRKDGSCFWANVIITALRDESGKLRGFSKITRDLTERKRAEELLREQFVQAQKMEIVGQLAGGIAHDFNNILSVIMGYSDLMMMELPAGGLLHQQTGEILHASQRAAALTRQLLFFSRKQVLQPEVLEVNDVIEKMGVMLRQLINEDIELSIILGPQTGRVMADHGYLGQILMNLTVNARDAMPEGGRLTIKTGNMTCDRQSHPDATPGDYVMLSVSDTGTGMTDEVKMHLFEAFFTTKPEDKGTGLGLATCQTIVRQSGGHITFESELGKGTTFKVLLPRVDRPVATGRTMETGTTARGSETVLLVEDEKAVRDLACMVLGSHGYNVISAHDGRDGLRVASEHKGTAVRLVITDVIMPQMNGMVMAEWLKATYPGLKVLFTSGYTDDAIAHHGVLDEGIDFLPKPYTPATLACKVREMLDAA